MSAEVEYRSARAKALSDAIVQDATAQILCLLGPLWQQIHRLCVFHYYAMSSVCVLAQTNIPQDSASAICFAC
jgi:hypothetical protein